MAPDDRFEPGRLAHVVVGNHARLLDARRTPLRVTSVRPEVGMFEVEVMAFEDAGARWDLPLEFVERLQFALDSAKADGTELDCFADAVRRFDRMLDIQVDDERRARTLDVLAAECRAAEEWFESSEWGGGDRRIDPAALAGEPRLIADLEAFMLARGLDDIECAVTRQYVSNPGAGELLKGHAIVLAQLGLTAYRGPVVRDPSTFNGELSLARRAAHLIARLAFVSTAFRLAGHRHVELFRGMSFESAAVVPRPTGTFVSATFRREIAAELSQLGPNRAAGVLLSQRVPVERLLFTHHETAAMNDRYHEAEAVLIADPTALF